LILLYIPDILMIPQYYYSYSEMQFKYKCIFYDIILLLFSDTILYIPILLINDIFCIDTMIANDDTVLCSISIIIIIIGYFLMILFCNVL